jgi:hypothetical protein
MPGCHRTKLALWLALKKNRSSRVNYLILAALPALCFYLWSKESFETAMKFFLFLFPYVFLFLSQDMIRDEVRSGALENVIFLGGEHKAYLSNKSFVLNSLALGYVGVLFAGLLLFALATHRLESVYFCQFLVGILVGIYYVHLAGLLSFHLGGGSNVLILILVQALAFIGIMFSVSQHAGFIDALDRGVFPDLISRLEVLAMVACLPNVVIWKKLWLYSLEILILLAFLIGLQKIKIGRLELKKQ